MPEALSTFTEVDEDESESESESEEIWGARNVQAFRAVFPKVKRVLLGIEKERFEQESVAHILYNGECPHDANRYNFQFLWKREFEDGTEMEMEMPSIVSFVSPVARAGGKNWAHRNKDVESYLLGKISLLQRFEKEVQELSKKIDGDESDDDLDPERGFHQELEALIPELEEETSDKIVDLHIQKADTARKLKEKRLAEAEARSMAD